MSDCPSSTAHLESRLDRSAFDKIFFSETLYIQQCDVLENNTLVSARLKLGQNELFQWKVPYLTIRKCFANKVDRALLYLPLL